MSIFRRFQGLERCGPGDAASLGRAARGLAPDAATLDAGCGTGDDLPVLLALVAQGRVTAIDLSEACIAGIRARLPSVRAAVADMLAPPAGPHDLIWSGGAICGPGIGPALTAWRRHLAPGGRVIFTDLVLRGGKPAPEGAEFLAAEGVPWRNPAALRAEVEAAGGRVTGGFRRPDTAWAADCLPPGTRLAQLEGAPDFGDRILSFRREIALWRSHGAGSGSHLVTPVPA